MRKRAKRKQEKRKRPSRYDKLPPKIPDTPENIAKAVLNTPPKKADEWRYLKKDGGVSSVPNGYYRM